MLKFAASEIYTISHGIIQNGLIKTNEEGKILSIETFDKLDSDVQFINGIICPGFINAHCHLELSYLKNKIPKKTGLVEFIKSVQQQRKNTELDEINSCIENADREMYENGIVAVADISNSDLSFNQKNQSKIAYYTFLEVFGFNPADAKKILADAILLGKKLNNLPFSITPHAPYSVSKKLFDELNSKRNPHKTIFTIHNQESDEENKFYLSKTGDFNSLYSNFGINIDYFQASGSTSLQTYLPWISSNQKMQLVHNTFTDKADIEFASQTNSNLFWCICPNANLYIENQLPNLELLKNDFCLKTIGTDSLASNSQLSILEEIITLNKHFPSIQLEELLTWATINGAKFLEMENELGTIEIGKKPGLVGIDFDSNNKKTIAANNMIKRLI